MTKNKLTVSFHWNAWEDYIYWRSHNAKVFNRINHMMKAIQQGKTKLSAIPLKGALEGFFAARINADHRLVYKITDATIIIAACRVQY
jgi:toxin YoeB